MAVLLNHSIFLHVPKTGGTWVRYALDRSGIALGESLQLDTSGKHRTRVWSVHSPLKALPKALVRDKYIFAFVRHPLSWFQSMWAFRMQTGWQNLGCSNEYMCKSNNFNEYVRKSLLYMPRRCTRIFTDILTTDTDVRVHYVGKYESLLPDLFHALDSAGETYNPFVISTLEKRNAAASLSMWQQQCVYEEDVLNALLKDECDIIGRFDYEHTDITQFLCTTDPVALQHSS